GQPGGNDGFQAASEHASVSLMMMPRTLPLCARLWAVMFAPRAGKWLQRFSAGYRVFMSRKKSPALRPGGVGTRCTEVAASV
ncbi:hypothetical protein ACWTQY_30125, partial [Klebsiella pneumoniae]